MSDFEYNIGDSFQITPGMWSIGRAIALRPSYQARVLGRFNSVGRDFKPMLPSLLCYELDVEGLRFSISHFELRKVVVHVDQKVGIQAA